VDVYTCGPIDTQQAVMEVVRCMNPVEFSVHTLSRPASPPSRNRS
jgi:S-adenosylmethionine/arginine decarboxylase-like enzyme